MTKTRKVLSLLLALFAVLLSFTACLDVTEEIDTQELIEAMIEAFCYADESYVSETEDGYISIIKVTEDYTCTVPGELYDISVTIAAGSYGEHGEDEDDGSWYKFYYIEATVDGSSHTLEWEEEGYNYEYTSVDITLDGEEVPYWGELYSDNDEDSSDSVDYESYAIPELDESYDSGAFDGTVTTGLSLIESILALQEEAEEYATSNCSAHHEDDVYIESWDSYADSVTYYFTDEDSDGEYDSGETCVLVKILYSGFSLYVYNYTSGSNSLTGKYAYEPEDDLVYIGWELSATLDNSKYFLEMYYDEIEVAHGISSSPCHIKLNEVDLVDLDEETVTSWMTENFSD